MIYDLMSRAIDGTITAGEKQSLLDQLRQLEAQIERLQANQERDYLRLDATNGNRYTAYQDTNTLTGFMNRTDSSLSFSSGSRLFSITSGSGFDIYIQGKKIRKNTENINVSTGSTLQFLYYDPTAGSGLQLYNGFPGFDKCLVASVYWNNTAGSGLLGDERHGLMDCKTHEYLHRTIGTRYVSGLNGLFTDTTFEVGTGLYYDEDIDFSLTAQTTCRTLYYNGSSTWAWTASGQTTPYLLNGSNIRYNNGTALADAGANQYVAYWVFATNDPTCPIATIMGQRVDSNLANARANNTFESLSLGTLPMNEMRLLYRVLYRNTAAAAGRYIEALDYRTASNLPSSTYTPVDHGTLTGLTDQDHPATAIYTDTSGWVRALSGSSGSTVQAALNILDVHSHATATTGCAGFMPAFNGYSGSYMSGSASWQDHGGLGGRTDDDHTQYALLAGRSGGQTLYGGTAASEGLTLSSTGSATKGKILFGASGAYDEANGRLGIGTTAPTQALMLSGDRADFIFKNYSSGSTTAGYNLNVWAGGAGASGTNLAGGNLLLAGGAATGTGTSNLYLQTTSAGTSGSAYNFPSTKFTLDGAGNMVGLKGLITAEGGYGDVMTAGSAMSRGQLVYVPTTGGANDYIYPNPTGGSTAIGVLYANTSASAAAYVVTNGIAYVLPDSGVTPARGNVLMPSQTAAGRVYQVATPGSALIAMSIGAWIDNGTGAGALTRAMLRF